MYVPSRHPVYSSKSLPQQLVALNLTFNHLSTLFQLTAGHVQRAVLRDVDNNLDGGIWLQVCQYQARQQVAGDVHNLALRLWLIVRLGVRVRVRGWLAFHNRFLHSTLTLVQLNNNVWASAVCDLNRLFDWVGGLSNQKRVEVALGVLDTNWRLQVLGVHNHRLQGLGDLLGVKALDQGSLQSSTSGGQLLRGCGTWVQSRGDHGGRLREHKLHVLGQLNDVGAATRKQDLVDVQGVKAGFQQHGLDERGHVAQGLSSRQFEAHSVNVGKEVVALGQRLHGERRRRDVRKGFLGDNRLGLQLGHRARVVSGVCLELLLELLSEVLQDGSVQVVTTQLMGVRSGQHGHDSASHGDDGGVQADSAKVGHHVDFVLQQTVLTQGGQRRGHVRQQRRQGLLDLLHDLQAGGQHGLLQHLSLVLGEVGGHRQHCADNVLAKVILSGTLQLAEVARSGLLNRHELGLALLAGNRISDTTILGLHGLGAVRGHGNVNFVKLFAKEIAEVDDRVGCISHQLRLCLSAMVLVGTDI
ncbi:NAD-specific glutamate dehydrogenase [Metschnikowia aff. pulcherrima]|uniref:NAD-specific glutamate dehydrogenase n=1 Tax=Metschnikowia aff. pulcherrima TaxID=2163413 RepID=A0A4P6XPH8_9ASCO|nr:NAD-specific glutamate dehydrogenase [Metschnikowia aff. pulcherrima]